MKNLSFLVVIMVLFFTSLQAQDNKLRTTLYDGFLIGGYVDNGAFLNFSGPNIKLTHHNSKFILGMLPSLRFKEDEGTTKNTFVTPALGVGFTYSYKMFAFQIPLYYNPKTVTNNGKWNLGVGLGLKIVKVEKNK